MLQSQPSPRHYGNPLLVRVTAEETVGVRFRGPASVPCACVDLWCGQHVSWWRVCVRVLPVICYAEVGVG